MISTFKSSGLIAVLFVSAATPCLAQENPQRRPMTLDKVCQSASDVAGGSGCPDVSDILPNAETAYAVGIAILRARYGASFLRQYLPYQVISISRQGEAWCLTRKFPRGSLARKGGGHPEICLLKKDGRVLQIGLSA